MNGQRCPFWVRMFLLLSGVFSLVSVLLAFFLQKRFFLMPCPLCILQRYFYLLVFFFSLFSFCPTLRFWRVGLIGGFLSGLFGFATAAYQLYGQVFPFHGVHCSVSFSNFLNHFPWVKWFPELFSSAGDCVVVQWRLFGVFSLPWVSLFSFFFLCSLLSAGMVYCVKSRRVGK